MISFTYAELCAKYNHRFKIMQYNSFLPAIPWKKRIKEHVESPAKLEDERFEKILQKENGLCKYLYSRFITKIHSSVPTS